MLVICGSACDPAPVATVKKITLKIGEKHEKNFYIKQTTIISHKLQPYQANDSDRRAVSVVVRRAVCSFGKNVMNT